MVQVMNLARVDEGALAGSCALVLGHIVCFNIDVTLQGNREETPADVEKAHQEAQELHDAGAKQWGTDESKFNQVIALRSFPQLRATFDEYAKVSP